MTSILPLLIQFLRANQLYKTEQALFEELGELQRFNAMAERDTDDEDGEDDEQQVQNNGGDEENDDSDDDVVEEGEEHVEEVEEVEGNEDDRLDGSDQDEEEDEEDEEYSDENSPIPPPPPVDDSEHEVFFEESSKQDEDEDEEDDDIDIGDSEDDRDDEGEEEVNEDDYKEILYTANGEIDEVDEVEDEEDEKSDGEDDEEEEIATKMIEDDTEGEQEVDDEDEPINEKENDDSIDVSVQQNGAITLTENGGQEEAEDDENDDEAEDDNDENERKDEGDEGVYSDEYEAEDDYDSGNDSDDDDYESNSFDFNPKKYKDNRRCLSAPLEQFRFDKIKLRELEMDLKSLALELKLEKKAKGTSTKKKQPVKKDEEVDEYEGDDDKGYIRVAVKRDHSLYHLIDGIEEYPDQQQDDDSSQDYSETEELEYSEYFDDEDEEEEEEDDEEESEEEEQREETEPDNVEEKSTQEEVPSPAIEITLDEKELEVDKELEEDVDLDTNTSITNGDEDTTDNITTTLDEDDEEGQINTKKDISEFSTEEQEINIAASDIEEEQEEVDDPTRRRGTTPIYDTMYIPVIHERNKTGFEESKDFPITIDSVIAGRYVIQEYLGSAAFSRAVQCLDLTNNQLVCIKIIKNSKDFFDQSLDEIRLLRYINSSGDADEYNVIQLYDFFYHREHLFLVCELLRDNLYEFSKYNRENEDELYFNVPRLQRITNQVLDGLSFIHSLGLIHCDLKPENILIRSYSRCLVKIIDFGSSCFTTDHLCSYVQSRTYRAPEVVLGLKYDQKVDVWSLGCILAELWTGKVLFVNKSIQTMLARIIGLCGEFPKDMLAKGQFTPKFFTKDGKLFEKNRKTGSISFLVPKRTTLASRLKCSDPLFVDFIKQCLQIDPRKRPTIDQLLQHPWILCRDYPPVVPEELL